MLSAIHILRASIKPLSIAIYESGPEMASGLAYGTTAREHILNVPVDRMSCDQREPLDFENWLRAHHASVFKDRHFPFVCRSYFKSYLQFCLERESSGQIVEHVNDAVQGLHRKNNQWVIESARGRASFDACVVATGYNSGMRVPYGLMGELRNVVELPYSTAIAMHTLREVAIVGTGLTAIDIWRSLRRNGFGGKVHFLSRRALFPMTYSIKKVVANVPDVPLHASPLFLLRWARALIHFENCDAAEIAQILRPHVTTYWQQWSTFYKRQFLNHLRPFWDSIRHRLPDTVHQELMAELKNQKTFVYKVGGLTAEAAGLQTKLILPRHALLVDKVFLATGAPLNLEPLSIEPGVSEKCALGLGLTSLHSHLFFVGPITRTTYWEISAVPDIRVQAQSIGEQLSALTSSLGAV